MSEDNFGVSILKKAETEQAKGALISTVAPIDDPRRYDELDKGLSEYSSDLFGDPDMLASKVRVGISKDIGTPFNLLILGAGTGKMARELVGVVGNPDNLRITEISMGDPRTPAEVSFDETHNINFVSGDINKIHLEKGKYDLAVSRWFLIHMADPLRVIKKISRSMALGAEFYADYKLKKGLNLMFRSNKKGTSDEKAILTVLNAQDNGALISVDNNRFYYRKTKNRLSFGGVKYKIDDSGKVYYEIA